MAVADFMRRLQILASSIGARLFRHQVGTAWIGNKIIRGPNALYGLRSGDILIRNARAFHAGVEGMSDLGGWVPVEVTPEMVGTTIAVYAQAEVKENARPTKQQIAWVDAVNAAGGRAGIVRSEDDLIGVLRGEQKINR